MIKYYTYIFGRTLKIDFREITSPPNGKGITAKSKALISQLINTDVASNGDINRQRYLFIREEDKVIFGIGINHQQYLENSFHTDETKKRQLRSFVGIVIDIDDFISIPSIPTNSSFFVSEYVKYIAGIWDLEDRTSNRKVLISEHAELEPQEDWCNLDGNIVFNKDESICHFYTPQEEEDILHSLKNCHSSIAIGLNTESHVITAAKRFNVYIPNAICLDTLQEKDMSLVNSIEENATTLKKMKGLANVQNGSINGGNTSTSQSQLNRKQEKRKSKNNESSPDTGRKEGSDTFQKPAILGNFKKVESETNAINERKDTSGEEHLMNFDWGDNNPKDTSKINQAQPDLNSGAVASDNTLSDNSEGFKNELQSNNETTLNYVGIPKKGYRLKLIIGGVIAMMIIIFVLSRCNKTTQTTPCPLSVSGDTIRNTNEKMK